MEILGVAAHSDQLVSLYWTIEYLLVNIKGSEHYHIVLEEVCNTTKLLLLLAIFILSDVPGKWNI